MTSFPTRDGQSFGGDVSDKLRALDVYRYAGSVELRRLAEIAANDPDVRVRLAYRLGAARGLGLTEAHFVTRWLEGIQGVLEDHFRETPKQTEAA